MVLNPVTQYIDDRNLRARQRLWEFQERPIDLAAWVLDLADIGPGDRVLDVGCGNGMYLRELRRRGVAGVGCDLSVGMLRATGHHEVVNADVTRLPLESAIFDTVLAPHMLYHVENRVEAAGELRRVLGVGGTCIIVTNGVGHLRSLRDLVEGAARAGTPDWEMRNPSTHAFSLENGADQLRHAFDVVSIVRPRGVGPVVIDDATVAADYVASIADHYQDEVDRPWIEVVEDVRRSVQAAIDTDGAFHVAGDTGAFICR